MIKILKKEKMISSLKPQSFSFNNFIHVLNDVHSNNKYDLLTELIDLDIKEVTNSKMTNIVNEDNLSISIVKCDKFTDCAFVQDLVIRLKDNSLTFPTVKEFNISYKDTFSKFSVEYMIMRSKLTVGTILKILENENISEIIKKYNLSNIKIYTFEFSIDELYKNSNEDISYMIDYKKQICKG